MEIDVNWNKVYLHGEMNAEIYYAVFSVSVSFHVNVFLCMYLVKDHKPLDYFIFAVIFYRQIHFFTTCYL